MQHSSPSLRVIFKAQNFFRDLIIVAGFKPNLRPLTIDSDSSENNVEPQPKKPSEPIVMTLDLSSNGKWRLNSSTD